MGEVEKVKYKSIWNIKIKNITRCVLLYYRSSRSTKLPWF